MLFILLEVFLGGAADAVRLLDGEGDGAGDSIRGIANSLGDSAESLGSERGIITQVEVDVPLERAIGVERRPAAAARIVALVGALPREPPADAPPRGAA